MPLFENVKFSDNFLDKFTHIFIICHYLVIHLENPEISITCYKKKWNLTNSEKADYDFSNYNCDNCKFLIMTKFVGIYDRNYEK